MKIRFLCIFISIIMLCTLVACGDNSATSSSSTDTAKDTIDTTSNDYWITPGDFSKDINIEETVLYDANDVKISATSLTYGNYDIELNLKFENNSNKNLSFIAESIGYSVNAVNEYMINDGYLNIDVLAGESAEDSIRFSYDELIIHGISQIAEIQVGFDIGDDDYNDIYTGPLTVKTILADSYNYENDGYRKTIQSKSIKYNYEIELKYFSENEIYNSNGISIVSEGYLVNNSGNRILMLEVKNEANDAIYFSTNNIIVNDTVICDSIWSYDYITSGKKMIVDINLDSILDEEEWAEIGITDISSIGFSIGVENEEYYVVAEPSDVVITLNSK